jgi:predicted RNA-binding Zn-ribbon protein involved in translation (DUF1610 family)
MKTSRSSILIAATLAVAAFLPSTQAAEPSKGAAKQLELIHIETVADIDALKTGDSIAMACTKCKTIWVSKVKQDAKGAEVQLAKGKPVKLIGVHGCPGCKGEVTISPHMKGRELALKHVCTACGDDSAFCCATRKAGDSTKGMEKGGK